MVSGLQLMEELQSFKSLLVVQRIKRSKTILQNFERVASWRGLDKVKYLSNYILRKTGQVMVKLCLGYSDGSDGELGVSLSKPNLSCVRPENRKLQSYMN